MMILEEANRTLAPGEIIAAMVRRNWLSGEARVRKGVYSTLSRLVREGRLVRFREGRYALPEHRRREEFLRHFSFAL